MSEMEQRRNERINRQAYSRQTGGRQTYDRQTGRGQAYSRQPGSGQRDNGQAYGGLYVYGNTVRKLEPAEPYRQVPVRQPQPEVRKNRDKARHMSAGYLLFLGAALLAAAFILVNYVQLQSELMNLTKTVATRERQLNTLKTENDEEYNRIVSGINLEEIKRIAIGELGMVYAEEGQIVPYTSEKNDYMRQVTKSGQ